MKRFLLLFLALAASVQATQFNWIAPATATTNATYYVGAWATFPVPSYVTVYKNGYYFASGADGGGNYTSDPAPGTASYYAFGESGWGGSYDDYRSVSIVPGNNPPTTWMTHASSVPALSAAPVTGHASDVDGDLRDFSIRYQGFGLQHLVLDLPQWTPTYSASVNLAPTATLATMMVRAEAFDRNGNGFTGAWSPITVTPIAPPVVTVSPAATTVIAGSSVVFTAAGGAGAHTWGGVASGTGSSKTVLFNTIGTQTVTVRTTAVDVYTDSNVATATITVQAPNVAPTTSIGASSTTITYGDSATLSFSCADENSNLVQWRFRRSNEPGASWSPLTGSPGGASGSFSTPTNLTVGSHTYLVEAVDAGGLTSSSSVTVEVSTRPLSGVTYSNRDYNGSAQVPGVVSVAPAGATYTAPTPSATGVGSYTASITGTGNYSGTVSNTWQIVKVPQAAVNITSAAVFTYGASYTATANGGSGSGALVWSLAPGGTAAGAAINSSTGAVTVSSIGTVVISVYRAGDANYQPSAASTLTVTIATAPLSVVTYSKVVSVKFSKMG